MKTKIQQGDVLLKRLNTIPSGVKTELSRGQLVLAEGEVTGHYHGINEQNSSLFQIGDMVVLDLKNDATLTHQEHGAIAVEAGIWEVGRVQEYDYFADMARQVAD